MALLRTYECKGCGFSDDRFVGIDDIVHCQICGEVMERMLTAPTIKLDGTDPGFPGAYSKWATTREKNAARRK